MLATEEVVFFQLGAILLSLLPVRPWQGKPTPTESSGLCRVARAYDMKSRAEFEAVTAYAKGAGARRLKTTHTCA